MVYVRGSVSIRLLRNDDISFVYELNVNEGWCDTRRDVERRLEYEPNSCLIVEVNCERVGHVFTVSFGELGWMGLLIVKLEHRRSDVGSMLLFYLC